MAKLTILPFLIVGSASLLVMLAAWFYQFKTNRAEIVDVCWTFLVGGSGIYFALTLDGDFVRRLVLMLISSAWAYRLGIHLIEDRVASDKEDGRYRDLRNSWGEDHQEKFLIFFAVQAMMVTFLSTAHYAVARNASGLGFHDILAAFVVLVALLGESLADRQLKEFKRNPNNKGKLCSTGLWSYSRHPNYFFEWLYWLSFPLLALYGSFWWLALLSPLFMYYLIRNVTGVKPMEERMRNHYGKEFELYESTTSEFFPVPKK